MKNVRHSKLPEILSEEECFPPAKLPSSALTLETLLQLNLKVALTGFPVLQDRKIQYKEKVEAPQMDRQQVYGCML